MACVKTDGPCPLNGSTVRRVADGRCWTVVGVERFAKHVGTPGRAGEQVGLLIGDADVVAGDELEFAQIESGTCRMFPSLTPDGATRCACLGVFAWRLLSELQAPLHRRASMAPYWIKALQARYVVCADTLRGCFVAGNQREVIAAYDRIRREAGDFDEDELSPNDK